MQERPSPSPSASTTGYTRGSMECPMAWLASRSVESDTSRQALSETCNPKSTLTCCEARPT